METAQLKPPSYVAGGTALLTTLVVMSLLLIPAARTVDAAEGCTITGTPGDDVLVGTDGPDVICGGAGNDTLIGGAGADVLHGEGGNDVLAGGVGNDRLFGGPGDDRLSSGSGHDMLEGGGGDDLLVGGFTTDNIDGGSGTDTCDDDPADQLIRCETTFASDRLRVMALGDSITEGGWPGGKYRTSLAEHMDDAGCRYDYVGSVLDQQLRWGDSYDPDHEGHGGWTADELLAEAPAWLAASAPDVVILHAGTNDLYQQQSVETTVADIEAIVGSARAANPAVTVLVARIIPGIYLDARVPELNAALDAAIPLLDQPSARVVLVDQYAGFDLPTHTHDNIHPNDAGARLMGDRFWAALEPLVESRCFDAAAESPTPTTTTTAPTTTTTTAPATTTTTTTTPPSGLPNLLVNGSVEGTKSPWYTSRWGTLDATHSWHDEGADGSRSLRVSVTGYTSGSATWIPSKTPVTAGIDYSFSQRYRSDVGTQLIVQYFSAAGARTNEFLAGAQAASGWRSFSTTLTPPTGTTHVRVLHLLKANGTLDIDDSRLMPLEPLAPGAELVINGSVEATTSSWYTSRWGTLNALHTWHDEGTDGARSLRVTVDSRSSGAATWVPAKSPVVGGSDYTFSQSYRSTGSTRLLAQHFTASGARTNKTLATLSPSANWSTYTATLTPPAGTTHTRVLHLLQGNGTLDIDDTSLVVGVDTSPVAEVRTVAGPDGFVFPHELATDNAGQLYVSDYFGHRVYRVHPTTGALTVIAGTGQAGYSGDGSAATAARLNNPVSMAFDSADNLYIADHSNHVVRRVDAQSGLITTIAGTGVAGDSGDGGPAVAAQLDIPEALAVSSTHVYVGVWGSQKVKSIDRATGVIETVANIPYTSAMAVDASGNLYVSSMYRDVIHKITPAGAESIVVGTLWTTGASGDGGPATAALINHANGLDVAPDGSLIISDSYNALIRRVDGTTGIITTIAGTGTPGYTGDNGPPLQADINPDGIAVGTNGEIYWAQPGDHVIRTIPSP